MERNQMPLGHCAPGEAVRVESLGTDTTFANRLRAMGIHDGAELDVVRTGATMIVRLKQGSRLCLRSDDVAHIWVSPAPTVQISGLDWSNAQMAPEGVDSRH